jgi:hypothetical protein
MDSVGNYFKILMDVREKSRQIESENSARLSDLEEKLRAHFRSVLVGYIPVEHDFAGTYRSPDYCKSSERQTALEMQGKERCEILRESAIKCRALKNVVTEINRHGDPPPAKLVYDGRRYGYYSDVTCSAYLSWSLLSSASLICDRVIGRIGISQDCLRNR